MSMIGIFDSGIGGLSILAEVRKMHPGCDLSYFGDTANVPYGGRSDDEIRALSIRAAETLKKGNPDLIIAACNTVTSVAIDEVRASLPDIPVVGVVPVLKTAAEYTKTGKIVVLATEATLKSESYQTLKTQFAKGKHVLELALPEWVTFVEQGTIDGPEVEQSVGAVAARVKEFGADIIALGCTHFPFLREAIDKALPDVDTLDSGPAVARQVGRVLRNNKKLPPKGVKGTVSYSCSGDVTAFNAVATKLLGEKVVAKHVT